MSTDAQIVANIDIAPPTDVYVLPASAWASTSKVPGYSIALKVTFGEIGNLSMN